MIARYDRAIADYFARQNIEANDSSSPGIAIPGLDESMPLQASKMFPPSIALHLRRREVLRYGENPHQQAALYASDSPAGANLVSARQLHGKELSYNNLLDLDSALAIARSLPGPGGRGDQA